MSLTFLDLLNHYDGGVLALAEATGVSVHTLYRVARGEHRKCPVRHVCAIVRAFEGQAVHGQPVTEERLWVLWASAVTLHAEVA